MDGMEPRASPGNGGNHMKCRNLYEQSIAGKVAAGVTAADDSDIAVILIKVRGSGKPKSAAGSWGSASSRLGG